MCRGRLNVFKSFLPIFQSRKFKDKHIISIVRAFEAAIPICVTKCSNHILSLITNHTPETWSSYMRSYFFMGG